jgi:4-hydroxyphenylpyruvate dioxygenase
MISPSRFALQTVSLGGPDLFARLRAARAAGFTLVELDLGQAKAALKAGHSAAAIRGELDSLGLRCLGGFETNVELLSSAAARADNHAGIEANARLVAALGGDTLVAGTDYADWPAAKDRPDPLGEMAETYAEVCARLAPIGVRLLLEFNWGMVKSLLAATEIVRRSGAPNGGVLFDPAHFHCTPTKSEHLTPEVVAHIRHVHVNNMPAKPAEFTDSNMDRVLPGDPKGIYDLRGLFGRLEAAGYRGCYGIEMFDASLRAQPPEPAARLLWDAMQTLA